MVDKKKEKEKEKEKEKGKEEEKKPKEKKSVVDITAPGMVNKVKPKKRKAKKKKRKSKTLKELKAIEEKKVAKEKEKQIQEDRKEKKKVKKLKEKETKKLRLRGWFLRKRQQISAHISVWKGRIKWFASNSLSILTAIALLISVGVVIWHLFYPDRWLIVLAGVTVIGMLGAINHFIDKK